MMKTTALFEMAAILFLLSGCVSEEIPTRMALGVPDGKVSYAPVPAAGLQLKMVTTPILYAGEEGVLIFTLSNNGRKGVEIPEWYACEPDNIHLYIQPRLTAMNAPDPGSWVEISAPPQRPVLHYPLVLLAGNKVIVEKKLPFLEKMQISAGHERRFYLRAELALKSLPLSTPVIELRVLPKEAKK